MQFKEQLTSMYTYLLFGIRTQGVFFENSCSAKKSPEKEFSENLLKISLNEFVFSKVSHIFLAFTF